MKMVTKMGRPLHVKAIKGEYVNYDGRVIDTGLRAPGDDGVPRKIGISLKDYVVIQDSSSGRIRRIPKEYVRETIF